MARCANCPEYGECALPDHCSVLTPLQIAEAWQASKDAGLPNWTYGIFIAQESVKEREHDAIS